MAKVLRLVAWTCLILGVIIGLGRLTVIRWWQVPLGDPYLEASLAPNLRGGDWVILWRGTAPIEGNLVLCPEPKAPERQVVGRIVGEGGDHVNITGGLLFVERRKFETENNCERFDVKSPDTGQTVTQNCQLETVGGVTHPRGDTRAELPVPKSVDVDVPPQHVFLASDNRQFPWDSREFGPVPRDTCTESIVYRLVSKDGFFDVANRLMLIH